MYDIAVLGDYGCELIQNGSFYWNYFYVIRGAYGLNQLIISLLFGFKIKEFRRGTTHKGNSKILTLWICCIVEECVYLVFYGAINLFGWIMMNEYFVPFVMSMDITSRIYLSYRIQNDAKSTKVRRSPRKPRPI